jgi:ubiquinone/menaquinone biosynthesis C-methylase UbiE
VTIAENSTRRAAAFDSVAASYDAAFTETRLGRLLRTAVQAYLAASFKPGMYILELNCGTGEDAVWMARRGIHVTATDASPSMLAMAGAKAATSGVAGQLAFQQLDLAEIAGWQPEHPPPGGQYDGVLSNFGGLNCLADRRPVAAALARWVRPGGRLIVVVMGPWCPWEILWHLAHGEARRAFRRLRAGAEAHLGGGAMVRVWYPSPRRLQADVAPWFRPRATAGIGVLLPPSYLDHLVDRWPGAFERLARVEAKLARRFPATLLNDHYLLELERTSFPTEHF